MSRPPDKRRHDIEPQIDRHGRLPQSGPMSGTHDQRQHGDPGRQVAITPTEPDVAFYLGFRAWMKEVTRRMNFKVVGACAGFVANTFAVQSMPGPAIPAAALGATGLGALIGRGIDGWLRTRRQKRQASLEAGRAETRERRCHKSVHHVPPRARRRPKSRRAR